MRTATFPALLLLVFAGGLSTASAAQLTRGPYTQNVDQDSATVAFRTDAPCPATVTYGPGSAQGATATSPERTDHFIVLDGLLPGTEYSYQVEACGQAQRSGAFQTAKKPGARQVHFGVFGDMGTGGTRAKEVAAALDATDPEFWLALGDTAYQSGTDAEFTERFFGAMPDLLADGVFFPVIGNHEYVTDLGAPYFAAFETPANNPAGKEHYYSFDWGNVHVVGLDSNANMTEQKAWLEQDLAKSKAPWKVVMMHHPVYSTGKHGPADRVQPLIPVFEAGGVDLVLSGHEHGYERSKPLKDGQVVAEGTPGAVTYVVVGNGGATLRDWATGPAPWDAVRNNTDYGFLEVKIDGGRLVGTLLGTNGQALDSFTLQKDVPAPPPTLTVISEPVGGQVQFVAQVDPADAVVTWDFGDGKTAQGAQVAHTFPGAGTYTVTTTATAEDQTATVQTQVAIPEDGTAPTVSPPTSSAPDPAPGEPVEQEPGPGEDPSAEPAVGCAAAGGLAQWVAPLVVLAGLLGFRLARGRRTVTG